MKNDKFRFVRMNSELITEETRMKPEEGFD